MNKKLLLSLALCMAAALALQCGDDDTSSPGGGGGSDTTFSGSVQPIFNSLCASPTCHGTAQSAQLSLVSGQSHADLVNIDAFTEPAFKRVLPGDPQNSYLVMRIEGRQNIGNTMPQIGSISASQITVIRTWIANGAAED